MIRKVLSRLDELALAYGSVSLAGPYGVLPYGTLHVVTHHSINAAWDEKLRARSAAECPETGPDCPVPGWAS
ncbi:MAG: hypothetical protein OEZ11_16155 [Gammaproteobacteria bacterium]|nr:hypothetical protein [Gammaproteobacteria bacterium]